MTQNPISCPICFQHWDFKTDHLGRLLAVHPIGKCVPRVEEAVPDDEEDLRIERQCLECGVRFAIKKNSPSQRLCGQKCRNVRLARRRLNPEPDRSAYWSARHVLEMLQKGPPKPRACVQCGALFTPISSLANKRILCSKACQWQREADRKKDRSTHRAA